ncbi:Rab family GTPase [Alteromonas sp. A081]|uniref:Rab family GTPase n=1 Tax=Alteromonas sp. A081 TaxID=3410269 RepID=UPI003B985EA5
MIQKKICLLGASGVGKTSLIRQYIEGIFSEKYLTSIGVKIDKKLVQLDHELVQLLIWDLEGIDRYCGFQPRYLRGTAACAVVVDQTRPQSLTDGINILKKIRKVTPAPTILVINKTDLIPSWQASEQKFEIESSDFTGVFNTSAKTGFQVEEMFAFIAQQSVQ